VEDAVSEAKRVQEVEKNRTRITSGVGVFIHFSQYLSAHECNFQLNLSPVARHSTVIIKQDGGETRGLRDTCSSQDILYFHDLYVASEVEKTREAKYVKSQLDGLLEK
jgi:hypothetical protein